MQIHLNLRNLTIVGIISAFTFIGYVILTSGERFPDVVVELRDVIRSVLGPDFEDCNVRSVCKKQNFQ